MKSSVFVVVILGLSLANGLDGDGNAEAEPAAEPLPGPIAETIDEPAPEETGTGKGSDLHETARVGEFPGIVSFKIKAFYDVYKHVCTGIVIRESWVVTSATCMKPYQKLKNDLVAACGGVSFTDFYFDTHEQISKIENIRIPANYYPASTLLPFGEADVALVEITPPYTLIKREVNRQNLWDFGADPDKRVVMPSWGRTSHPVFNFISAYLYFFMSDSHMHKYEMTLQNCTNSESMRDMFKESVAMYSDKICARTDTEKCPCDGDGGSPLLKRVGNEYYVIGVYIGPGACIQEKDDHQIFTELKDYWEFIDKYVYPELKPVNYT